MSTATLIAPETSHAPSETNAEASLPGNRQFSQQTHAHWQLASLVCAGPERAYNQGVSEDSAGHRASTDGSIIAAVADGVSAGARGDIASFAAVNHCLSTELLHNLAKGESHSLSRLDSVVQEAVASYSSRSGATTLAAVWLSAEGQGQLTRVGDCRAYHLSTGAGQRLSLSQLLADQNYTHLGELPPVGIPANNPARMIGNGHMGTPELCPISLQAGDALLLCSDGLHRHLSDRAISLALAQLHQPEQWQAMLEGLALQALQQGGNDDIAVLLLRYQPN
jgi:PPM family protein phosphatase